MGINKILTLVAVMAALALFMVPANSFAEDGADNTQVASATNLPLFIEGVHDGKITAYKAPIWRLAKILAKMHNISLERFYELNPEWKNDNVSNYEPKRRFLLGYFIESRPTLVASN